jgi:hypothetical protein
MKFPTLPQQCYINVRIIPVVNVFLETSLFFAGKSAAGPIEPAPPAIRWEKLGYSRRVGAYSPN